MTYIISLNCFTSLLYFEDETKSPCKYLLNCKIALENSPLLAHLKDELLGCPRCPQLFLIFICVDVFPCESIGNIVIKLCIHILDVPSN